MRESRLRTHVRIVLAIAWKDIIEAVRNKVVVGLLFSAIFVVALYRALPLIDRLDPPTLVIYDAGDAALTPMLENSSVFDVRTVSQDGEAMRYRLSHEEAPALGLVIPADFDAVLGAGGMPNLVGYTLHWVKPDDVRRLQRLAEGEISAALGTVIPVRMAEERVYPRPDASGRSVSLGISTVYVLLLLALMLPPNLMLDKKKAGTLNAVLVSPASAAQVVEGKAIAGLFYATLGGLISFIVNGSVMVHWDVAIATAVTGALFAVSLGLLLGTLLESRQQLMLWGWVLTAPLLLSMMLYLLEELIPTALVSVLSWTPITVMFRLIRTSFAGAIVATDWLGPLLVLAAYAAGALGLVIWAVRRMDRA